MTAPRSVCRNTKQALAERRPSIHDECDCAFPRRQCARVLLEIVHPPRKREGAGNAGCAPHRRSRTQWREWVRARAYRLSGGIRHPLRNGFTAYAALSSATNSSCHRRRRIARQLDPVGSELSPPTWHQQRVSGPHGFAVRYNVVRPARLHIAHEVQLALRPPWRADALASTTSHPAFVTTRDRPSCRNGTARVKPLIWGRREAQFCPSRHSAAACRAVGRMAAYVGAALSFVIPGSRQRAPRNDGAPWIASLALAMTDCG